MIEVKESKSLQECMHENGCAIIKRGELTDKFAECVKESENLEELVSKQPLYLVLITTVLLDIEQKIFSEGKSDATR